MPRPTLRLALTSAVCVLVAAPNVVAPSARGDGPQFRAPPPPVSEERDPDAPLPPFRAGTIEYSHGDPTAEEQHFMELMNRARRDPDAEAERVFADYGSGAVTSAVDFFLGQRPGVEWTREENRAAFHSYPARPPLAFNADLIDAARAHTQRMKDDDLQSHQLPGELPLGGRVTAEGYAWSALAESVFANAEGMLFAHAAFAIDWGQGVNQSTGRPAIGHRTSLMNQTGPVYVEAGVGVLSDTDPGTDVGPKLITIDFASPLDGARFVTGVCYVDTNSDGAYDPGEGVRGVRIESPATESFTITSTSGGYALPVPASSGSITVTAIGQPGTPGESFGIQDFPVVMGADNVKLDITQAGDPPPPPFPEFVVFTSAPNAALPDGTTDFPIDPGSITVSDLDVGVDLAHGDFTDLRLSLVAPDGTTAVLFDRGLAAGTLTGTFDTTLAPEQDLGVFAEGSYTGAWRLRVEDLDPGTTGTLASWSLRIRPMWMRPLSWNRTNLVLSRLKAKDAAEPGTDSLALTAVVDAGGAVLDATKPVLLRLRDGASGAELFRADVTLGAIQTRTKSSSKYAVKAKAAGVDLPALPANVTVELAVGGALVRETVPLVNGAFKATTQRPASELFVVDTVTSTLSGSTRTTTVKGRVLAPFDAQGLLEVLVGDTVVELPGDAYVTKGTKRVAKSLGALRKFTIDTATGAFLAKVVSGHEAVVDGVVPFGLRLGSRWFDDAVKPTVRGASATY